MKCNKCGATLTDSVFCNNCGTNVKIYKKLISTSNALYNRGLERAKVRDLTGAKEDLKKETEEEAAADSAVLTEMTLLHAMLIRREILLRPKSTVLRKRKVPFRFSQMSRLKKSSSVRIPSWQMSSGL